MEYSEISGNKVEGKGLRFKLEVTMLSIAIALFIVSSFFYSYQMENTTDTVYASINAAASAAVFPFRMYAVSLVGLGSVLMIAASISYQRRSKNLLQQIQQQ